MLSPNVLPQSPQTFAAGFPIDGLALGVEFSMHNKVDVEKKKMGMLLHEKIAGYNINTIFSTCDVNTMRPHDTVLHEGHC